MMPKVIIYILLLNFPFYLFGKISNGTPVDLKCEYLINPLGIDLQDPRLSWRIDDQSKGAIQTAYQIVMGTDSLKLINNHGNTWDTGKLFQQDRLVTYSGNELKPFTRYFWKVISWDKNGRAHSSEIAFFETGMLGAMHWKGTWISDQNDINYKPAPYFRKQFSLKKKIKSARAYIAAAGLFELAINGNSVGNHFLDPLYTRYDRRILYVTHDVTTALQSGENAIGVVLGNGWYNHQALAVWNFHQAPWRARPAFCLDLRIVYTDGSEEIIVSNQDWKTFTGPLRTNNIYTGEQYDFRLEQPGWNKPGFDDSNWQNVSYRSAPASTIASQQVEPIRLVKEFKAEKVNKLNSNTYLFDMGQNMAGVTKIKARGEEGTVLKIAHGERLDKKGRLDLSNIDVYYRGDKEEDPFQTDIVILSGKNTDEFIPKFSYKGFRYIEITSSRPISLDASNVTAYAVHSDVKQKGYVHTSSPMVNTIWQITNNAYLSNLMGYPTDCPQREKNGWTGDGHLAIETALYNYDGITVYEKWLADHRDEQQPNGVLPDIIPTGGWGYGSANGLDWTSTIAIIPWEIYQYYGDSRLLRDCYENIKRYVEYVNYNSPNGLTTFGRGDWVPVKSTSDLELTSSVYYFVDTKILAQTAKLFGKTKEYEKYNALSQKIKNAINTKFLDRERGIYASGTQTEMSMPLHWGIVPEELKTKVAANLNQLVVNTNYHLDVGVLGAKAILNALNNNGYSETAYKLAVQDTYPSWGWWAANGATTLLENWDLKATRDISDNHMMFGEIGGWFFKSLGGILPDPDKPGFKHIILKPILPEGLDFSEVIHDSPYGKIISKWTKQNNFVVYDITIPANTSATFYPPENVKGEGEMKLFAGRIQFKLPIKNE